MDDIRETVDKLYKERSVVTDLICQCLTQSIRSYDRTTSQRKLLYSKSQPQINSSNAGAESSNNESNSVNSFNNSNNNNNDGERGESAGLIGPLSAFTEESIDILNIANENIDYGKQLRQNSHALIRDAIENAKLYSGCIDDTFKRKIEEALALSVIIFLIY